MMGVRRRGTTIAETTNFLTTTTLGTLGTLPTLFLITSTEQWDSLCDAGNAKSDLSEMSLFFQSALIWKGLLLMLLLLLLLLVSLQRDL